jgi:hypothetical protein
MSRRRRYKKNPDSTTILLLGGGALAAFLVYRYYQSSAVAVLPGQSAPNPLTQLLNAFAMDLATKQVESDKAKEWARTHGGCALDRWPSLYDMNGKCTATSREEAQRWNAQYKEGVAAVDARKQQEGQAKADAAASGLKAAFAPVTDLFKSLVG